MTADEILEWYRKATGLFSDRVHAVHEDQWGAPTPDTEWSVRALVNHLTVEQLWVPPLVSEGATTEQIGDALDGDRLGDDPVGAWDAALSGARKTFGEPGALDRTVSLSFGETRAAAYCSQMTLDAAVHSWDLSRAIGADEQWPDGLAAVCLREVEPYAGELTGSGMFADPVEPPEGADDRTRLLCLLGRRP